MVTTSLRILYADTDQMGVVYHGNYLRFFEQGRAEFLRDAGEPYAEAERVYGMRLPVVEALVTYKAPAHYDEIVSIHTRLVAIGRASLRFAYEVTRGETVLALGHTAHACVDMQGKVQKLPTSFAQRLSSCFEA